MGPGYRFEFKTCASAGTEDGAVYQYLRYDGVQTSGQVTVRNGQWKVSVSTGQLALLQLWKTSQQSEQAVMAQWGQGFAVGTYSTCEYKKW